MTKLTETDAKDIKQALWDGRRTTDIAITYGVSQPLISQIKSGLRYRDVPWPDGAVGPMPVRERQRLMPQALIDETDPLCGFRDQKTADFVMNAHMHKCDRGCDNLRAALNHQSEMNALDDAKRLMAQREAEGYVYEDWEKADPERYCYGGAAPPSTDRMPTPSEPEPAPYMPWADIVKANPKHPLVLEALSNTNETLMRALGMVFFQLPSHIWERPMVIDGVHMQYRALVDSGEWPDFSELLASSAQCGNMIIPQTKEDANDKLKDIPI